MPYRSLSIFEICRIPLPGQRLGIQQGLVAGQVQARSKASVLKILTQDNSRVQLHVGITLLKVVELGKIVNLAILRISLD